jgi:hypothetical protein
MVIHLIIILYMFIIYSHFVVPKGTQPNGLSLLNAKGDVV